MPKIAFITGATAGFGKECAKIFAGAHWNLILVSRTKENLHNLKKNLEPIADIHILPVDIGNRSKITESIGSIPDHFKKIDLLINNAGLALGADPAHIGNIDDWEIMVNTNIKGLMYCTRLLLPQMVERDNGHIINIGSIAGSWAYPNINVYGGTKAFVRQFSLNLRADLFGTNVRVSLIEPGLGETDFAITRFKGDKVKAGELYKGIEALKPKDVAEIIYWVAHQPKHVNINSIEVMPTCQTWGPLALNRQ